MPDYRGDERGRLNLYMDQPLIDRVKRIALSEGTTATKWIAAQIREILKQKRKTTT